MVSLEAVHWLSFTDKSFKEEVERVQNHFVSNMTVGEGIARNEALCENLFMILVSVLNKIPIFVIGVPGSSKSLAMRLIQSNLRGVASMNAFLKKLPAVEVFPCVHRVLHVCASFALPGNQSCCLS